MSTIPAFTSDADWSAHYGADGLPHGASSGELAVTATGSDQTVTVAAGEVLVQDMRHVEPSPLALDLGTLGSSPSSGQAALDLVVARLTRAADYTTEIDVVPGTPATAGSEVEPDLTRDATIYEVALARVRRVGTAATTQANVTDLRRFRAPGTAELTVVNDYTVSSLSGQWVTVPLTRNAADSAVSDGDVLGPGFTVYGRGIHCAAGGRLWVTASGSWDTSAGIRVVASTTKVTDSTNPSGATASPEVFTSVLVAGAARQALAWPLDVPSGAAVYLQLWATSVPCAEVGFRPRLTVTRPAA